MKPPSIVMILSLAGCASAGGLANPSAPALDPAQCATLAEGRLPDGRSIEQAYDSLFALARQPGSNADVTFVPVTRKARLTNATSMAGFMERNYPTLMRGRRGATELLVAFLVDTRGAPKLIRLLKGSGLADVDRASLDVVEHMEFAPARAGSCVVPMFVQMPITFAPAR
jgi:TonB family protein